MNKYLLRTHHRLLLMRHGAWFREVAHAIHQELPAAQAVWCHGYIPSKVGANAGMAEWEFVVLLPDATDAREVERLNDFNSPLDRMERIAGRKVDLQVARLGERSTFTELMRQQGFPIWQRGQVVRLDDLLNWRWSAA